MKTASLILCFLIPAACYAESPEDAAAKYFEALAQSNKEQLVKVVYEPSATRIGKSIIAASPMFHRSKSTEFFEMIFDRVPTLAEIESMSPIQAFAEYMCEPKELESKDGTTRTILGTITEDESLAHVVYRVNGAPNLAEKSRDVVTCIKHDGEWRVVVSARVWDAYMNFMLQPAMAKLSGESAEP